jgi:uncharacterized protein
MSNIETIRQVYAAFARGDIDAILNRLSETVQWEAAGSHTDVPWLLPRRGRDGVARFFEVAGNLQINSFEPKAFLEADQLVVVLLDEDVTVKATGRRIRELDQVHIWRFDEHGAVLSHHARLDTHRHWCAFHDRSSPATAPAQ